MRYKLIAKVAYYISEDDEFLVNYMLVDEQCNTHIFDKNTVLNMNNCIDNLQVKNGNIGIRGVNEKFIPYFDMRGTVPEKNRATILGVSHNGQSYMVMMPDGNTLVLDGNDLYVRCMQGGLKLSNAKIDRGRFCPKAGTFFKF